MTGWSGARQRRRDRRFLLTALLISNALPGPLQGDEEGVNLSGSCVRAVIRWEIKRWPRDVRSNSTILPLHRPRKNSWICCRSVQTCERTGGALLSAAAHGGAGLGTCVVPCSSPSSAGGSLTRPIGGRDPRSVSKVAEARQSRWRCSGLGHHGHQATRRGDGISEAGRSGVLELERTARRRGRRSVQLVSVSVMMGAM